MPATLIYQSNSISTSTKCTICLDPVDRDAINISCHTGIDCADCITVWINEQLASGHRATCPRCRVDVSTSDLIKQMKEMNYANDEGVSSDDGGDGGYDSEEYSEMEDEEYWSDDEADFDENDEGREEGDLEMDEDSTEGMRTTGEVLND